MIPKVIHYCWFGRNELPESVKKCIESWKKYCPDYKIVCWNEDNFNIFEYSYTNDAYKEKKWAFVSDVARLKVVYDNGGIYLDTDVELIKPLDELLSYSSFWAFENEEHIATGLGFGACKNNSFVKALLNDYEKMSFYNDAGKPVGVPCTDLNTTVFRELGVCINNKTLIIDNNIFLATEYMCPIDYNTGRKRITNKTISIHHYDSSWHSKRENQIHRIEVFTRNMFGEKISKKITNCFILFFDGGIKAVFNKIVSKGYD